MKKVLVTGGCGYIGSHTIVDLIGHGFEVVPVDSLINSDASVMDQIGQIANVSLKNNEIDLCDFDTLEALFQTHPDMSGIIHFAALKAVGESVEQPLRYYQNNLTGLLNILQCARKFRIPNFIFSSSCSVYGNAKELPVTENTPWQEAESPYAYTKQIGERMLVDLCHVEPAFNAVILRYFNPAGAHESGLMGESPINPALNLVPVITETAIGKRPQMTVHGNDYDTRDGTCIRDYIHVMDLANAHTRALQYLVAQDNQRNLEVFNLGIGQGVTVMEVIKAFEKVTGRQLNYRLGPRRAGDVIAIYSNFERAAKQLGWTPQRNIEDIMHSAWQWEQKRSGVGQNSR